MYQYQINVSLDGHFAFRTDMETNKTRAQKAFNDLRSFFPVEYKIELTRWTVPVGTTLTETMTPQEVSELLD